MDREPFLTSFCHFYASLIAAQTHQISFKSDSRNVRRILYCRSYKRVFFFFFFLAINRADYRHS